MKVILCIILSMVGITTLHAGFIPFKIKNRHTRIMQKKVDKWGLRDSGQQFPDRYGYSPR